MKIPFRTHHLLQLLQEYDEHPKAPLDYAIAVYFKKHRALGSKDRAWISDTCYGLVRWKGLLDFLTAGAPSWEARLNLFVAKRPQEYLFREEIPQHVRVSFPKELFDLFVEAMGEAAAVNMCLILNERAPTTVRANPLKIGRDALVDRFRAEGFSVIPCAQAPFGICFLEKTNFFTLPEFREGLFEVQDEGSQLVAEYVPIKPGDLVVDFCAGAGGKSLAMAHKLQKTGQLFLTDIRSHALQEAAQRLRRNGIQNAQIIFPEEQQKKFRSLHRKANIVLVDAPCTGTGTLRRNPDMKWRFTPQALTELIGKQRNIFERALSLLKPGGRIIYATCSILPQENEFQIAHFLKTYSLTQGESPLKILPSHNSCDGFFAASLSACHPN